MEVVLDSDTGEQERWAFVKEGTRIELGAQVVPDGQPLDLVVIWRASVAPERLRDIVRGTYQELRSRSDEPGEGRIPVRCRITGYGRTKEFLQPAVFFKDGELPYFEACRAELETPEDAVVVWANVASGDDRSLAEASDNIGMRIPLSAATGWGGNLIADAVSATREIGPSEVRGWLNAAVEHLLAEPR